MHELKARLMQGEPLDLEAARVDSNQQHNSTRLSAKQKAAQALKSWSMVHSFLALSGGFAVYDGTDEEQIFPDGYNRLTFTHSGLLWVFEMVPNAVPDIESTAITDKAKSDDIAKILVLIQGKSFYAIHSTLVDCT